MRRFLAGLSVGLLIAACAPTASSQTCDPQAIRAVQAAHENRAEVTICGPIVRVGRLRRTRSGVHRAFIVDVGANDRVAVDANVEIMGNFPIHIGEAATVRGEYYYDAPGREGVHWTHRTDHGTHPPGFVVLSGVTYQ